LVHPFEEEVGFSDFVYQKPGRKGGKTALKRL
jgi:hypothetical protein